MGQKVNPHGLRVGVIKDWDSRWYAESEFADYLAEDYKIRKHLKAKLKNTGVAKIEIERTSDRVKVVIYSAKPGLIIGRGGARRNLWMHSGFSTLGWMGIISEASGDERFYIDNFRLSASCAERMGDKEGMGK